jgi:hydrogenase maturation protein HypF
VEVEGDECSLRIFLLRIDREKPPRAFIQSLEHSWLDPVGLAGFTIRESDASGCTTSVVLPDIATCPDCLREIFDPANRRHLYPFTNCTHCGPRFTIIESMPYDRANTSMKVFTMCSDCRSEYDDPRDRRFHAQPTACPRCGPYLELWDESGAVVATHHLAIAEAAAAVKVGSIVAIKGIGGFQLIADATNEEAVMRLRRQKHREEKPFALMFPSLTMVNAECAVSDFEERLLLSPESPIVLLQRCSPDMMSNGRSSIASSVAPRNPYLGVLLPYTPLHHILMREIGTPVVATSGNVSDEPICIDEHEAVHRLEGIADLFLVHNRPIVRHVDDSVVRIMAGREMVMRRARGYAPLPVQVTPAATTATLAVGAHLKNAVALTAGENVYIGQHIGDLETPEAYSAFRRVIDDLQVLYRISPQRVACDLHPEYISTKFAQRLTVPVFPVQHHYAHVVSCMAENQLEDPVLGVSWDGTGYGPDGTIWGGEFLVTGDGASFERVASFRQFMLPGGDTAIKEPRRAALGLLYEMYGDALFRQSTLSLIVNFSETELVLLRQMLTRNINAPRTSSAGRLFDAVASIIGLRQRVAHEGQAAMELEFSIGGESTDDDYGFEITDYSVAHPVRIIDWGPIIMGIIEDVQHGERRSRIAAKFHNTLVAIIVAVSKLIGQERIVLTGGCFQNRYLTERTVYALIEEGFRPYWHQRVPPNDGGIALGQLYASLKSHTSLMSTHERQEETIT